MILVSASVRDADAPQRALDKRVNDSTYNDYGVRRAVEEDALAIANVHVLAWQYAYKEILPAAILNSQSVLKRADFWSSYISDSSNWPVFVLEGKQVEGFASVIPARGDDVDPKQVSELAAIYISEKASGQQLGMQLLSSCLAESRSRERDSMILWVLEKNEKALRFYKKHGFSADGESIYDERLEANEIRLRADINCR